MNGSDVTKKSPKAVTYTLPLQVGNGPVSPTFNVGGQFDNNGITPVVGGGLSVGNNNGGFNPAVGTGFALSNGQARPVVGAGAQVGSFNLNNLFG